MTIIKSEFALALNQLATERGVSVDDILTSIETAVITAYKKEYPHKKKEEIKAKINRETGETKIFENSREITPKGFGRIAAQTAKQVILQKIREAEKKNITAYYNNQIGTILRGRVIRYDGLNCYLDIGKAEAILPKEEQIKNEQYQPNKTFFLYLKKIANDKFGNPQIIVSRSDPKLLEELFKREVPEITNKTVVIKKVVRAPGERAKIAVFSTQSGVDPIGACVGQKGIRVQTVTDKLGGLEKIDIIQWNKDEKLFLMAALQPAKIEKIDIDSKTRKAKVTVDEKEAPLAIGKGGVNVNLASKLTEFDIDIVQISSPSTQTAQKKEVAKETPSQPQGALTNSAKSASTSQNIKDKSKEEKVTS